MYMMEDKFDVKTLRAWETKSSETVTCWNLKKNRSLILERIESRSNDRALKERELRSKGSHGHSKSQAGNKGAANLKTSSLTSSLNTGKCFLCDGSHLLSVCEKFLALSVADRIKEVKRLKLCKLPQKRS